MEELDPKSYRLLKKINRNREYKYFEPSRELTCIHDTGFIESATFSMIPFESQSWRINQNGIIYILNRKQANGRWWIPIIISGLAVLIAGAAFIVSITKQ